MTQVAIGEQQLAIGERGLKEAQRQNTLLEEVVSGSSESEGLLQTIANDLADNLAQQIGSQFSTALQQRLAPALERITEIVEGHTSEASAVSLDSSRRFTDELVQQLNGALQTSFSDMGARVESVGQQMETMSASLKSVVDTAVAAVADQRTATSETNAALREAHDRSRDAADQVASVQTLAVQFGELTTALQERHSDLVSTQAHQAELQTRSDEHVATISGAVATATSSYHQTAQGLMAVMEQLSTHLARLEGHVNRLGERTDRAASTLDQAVSKLGDRVEREHTLVNQFGQTASTFEKAFASGVPVVSQLGSVATGLRTMLETISAEQERLTQLVGTIQGANAQVRDLAAHLNDGFATGERMLTTAAERAATAVEATEDWATRANTSIEEFGERLQTAVRQSLDKYDTSLSIAVKSLGDAMKSLADVAEEIADKTQLRAPQDPIATGIPRS